MPKNIPFIRNLHITQTQSNKTHQIKVINNPKETLEERKERNQSSFAVLLVHICTIPRSPPDRKSGPQRALLFTCLAGLVAAQYGHGGSGYGPDGVRNRYFILGHGRGPISTSLGSGSYGSSLGSSSSYRPSHSNSYRAPAHNSGYSSGSSNGYGASGSSHGYGAASHGHQESSYAPAPVQHYSPAPVQSYAPAPKYSAPAHVQSYAPAPASYSAPSHGYSAPSSSYGGHKDDYAAPTPYDFGYDVHTEHGDQLNRKESGDGHGNVQGSYGYKDAYGIFRHVDYVADKDGFRASVQQEELIPADPTLSGRDLDRHNVSSRVEKWRNSHRLTITEVPLFRSKCMLSFFQLALIASLMAVSIAQKYGGSYGHSAPSYGAPSYKQDDYAQPIPFQYGFDIQGGDHKTGDFKQTRSEHGDGHGNVQGSYGYTDAHGVYRQVDYVADGHGYRASVKTNEPGTENQSPADVELHAQPSHGGYAPAGPAYGHSPY
ncbi:hypothetical protein JTE90_001919 [Oedothorax gibbosus]|uniref:Cuticle protein n=1 Tax=Oedothorax gibbosus TaxID=931172 RepID=A0AAV6VVE2_9ARAC|nr:hypothetical protein JTE90_001919 [Oedothorax gibbosus]